MKNISDVIEAYLKETIHTSNKNMIIIKRNEIANKFQCVPSQINYVISTRFTIEKGFEVESKRGGAGYIQIKRIEHRDKSTLLHLLYQNIHQEISQMVAERVLERLLEEEIISKQEKRFLSKVIDKQVLLVELPTRDIIRANIIKELIRSKMYD